MLLLQGNEDNECVMRLEYTAIHGIATIRWTQKIFESVTNSLWDPTRSDTGTYWYPQPARSANYVLVFSLRIILDVDQQYSSVLIAENQQYCFSWDLLLSRFSSLETLSKLRWCPRRSICFQVHTSKCYFKKGASKLWYRDDPHLQLR